MDQLCGDRDGANSSTSSLTAVLEAALLPVESDEHQFPAERNVIEGNDAYLISYCRVTGERRSELERSLLRYCGEDGKSGFYACAAFCSGMNAVCAVFQNTLFKCGSRDASHATQPHVVIGDEMYCDVKRTVVYFSKIFRFTYEFVDVRDTKKLAEVFEENRERMALLFVESCTNPSGQMMDMRQIAELKRIAPQCVVCVDNTWLSHVLFRPLLHGADLVLESMTKYVSGSRCIGGMLIGRTRLMRDLARNWTRIYGQYLLPRQCQYFIDGITSIEQRVARSGPLTLDVARYLEAHRAVNRVLYPLLESHPTYCRNTQLLPGGVGPSVLIFHVGMRVKDRKEMYRFFQRSPLRLETSYGSSYTKLDPWAKSGPSNKYDLAQTAEKKEKSGLWIRLAVGYDDTLEQIIGGLVPLLGTQ